MIFNVMVFTMYMCGKCLYFNVNYKSKLQFTIMSQTNSIVKDTQENHT